MNTWWNPATYFFFELIREKKKNNETEKGTVLLENQIRNIKEKRAAL